MLTHSFTGENFSVIQKSEFKGTTKGFAIIPNNWRTNYIISTLFSEEEKHCILTEAVEHLEKLIERSKFGLEDEIIFEAKNYTADIFNDKIIMY